MKTDEFFMEPKFPGEYQAFGLVQGVWFPRAEKATTGWLLCDAGCSQIESTLMRDVKDFVYSHSDISQTLNYFNVYPRTLKGQLSFQVKFLHNKNASNWADWRQQLEANSDRFRLRGAIRSLTPDAIVLHIQQNVKPGRTPSIQFEVEVKGEVNSLEVGQFVEVFAQRTLSALEIESLELTPEPRRMAINATSLTPVGLESCWQTFQRAAISSRLKAQPFNPLLPGTGRRSVAPFSQAIVS